MLNDSANEGAPSAGRDLAFTPKDFERVRGHIHRRAGIALADHKAEMVYSRLARRLRALGTPSFAGYLALLEADAQHAEWEYFVNALTTNLTAFFREAYHFPLLGAHVNACTSGPRIWSCGVSTGEEAYSIAMTLAAPHDKLPVGASILATDIDTRALAVARAGIYRRSDVDSLPAGYLKRFLLKGSGARAGQVRLRADLVDGIDFQPLNLLAPRWDTGAAFDAIFCRNVMIYFDAATQRRLLDRFATCLKPGGLLFVGHSESFRAIAPAYRLRSHAVYELATPAITAVGA